jgi:predicted RNase H-like HicB family nuclease
MMLRRFILIGAHSNPRIMMELCSGTTLFHSRMRQMVVAEALDFPGAVTQGFDLSDARHMIASALEDVGQALLEEGKPLPVPSEDLHSPDADLIELAPLSLHAGTALR